MPRTCQEFSAYESGPRDVISRKRIEWHVQQCEECRVQLEAHRELQHVTAEVLIPNLSPAFTRELQARLHVEPAAASLSSKARRWMRVYWTAAGVISALILILAGWPGWMTSPWLARGLLILVVSFSLIDLIPATRLKRAAFRLIADLR